MKHSHPRSSRFARLLACLATLSTTTLASAAIINVPADHATIQAAIDASVAGDEVVVALGTYVETLDLGGKAITLRSTDPMDPAVVATTIVDGGGADSVIVASNGEGPDTVISGLTIINGAATRGGGMMIEAASPTVSYCTFVGNTALDGAGMSCRAGAAPSVTACRFIANSADALGGGLYSGGSSPTVIECTFGQNLADHGGGIAGETNSTITVTDCMFDSNTADSTGGAVSTVSITLFISGCSFTSNTTSDRGGGIFNQSSTMTLSDSIFEANVANSGGGILMFNVNTTSISDCTFIENTTTSNGGGMLNQLSSPDLTNCTFIRNQATGDGGGLHHINAAPLITNCVFEGNTATRGGAMTNMHLSSTPTLMNCVFRANLAYEGSALFGNNGDPTLTDCSFCYNSASVIDSPYTDGGGNDLDACAETTADTGACCLPGGDCVVTMESECLASGGVYSGNDVTCATAGCIAPCTGDVNVDGSVNFADLVALLSAWGVCP